MTTDGYLEELKKLAECPVCHKTATDARLLPCFHAVCSPCLQTLLGTLKAHGDLGISCPVCSFKADATEELDSFPPARFLNSFSTALLKVLILKTTTDCSVCKRKEQATKASVICLDCAEILCDNCHFCHKTFLEEHTALAISEVTNTDIDNFLERRQQSCKKHKHGYLRYCCHGCNQLLCTFGYVESHQEHPIKRMKTSADEHKEHLKFLSMKLDGELSACLVSSRKCQETTVQLNEVHKSIHEKIKQHARSAKLTIDKSEAQLLKAADCKQETWTAILNCKMTKLDAVQSQIKQSCNHLNMVVERGTDADICHTYTQESPQLYQLLENPSNDRHTVPLLNMSLVGDYSNMFHVSPFLLADKTSEFEIPFKPGAITCLNGQIAVCEHEGTRVHIYRADGHLRTTLKTSFQFQPIDITYCDVDKWYVVSSRMGHLLIFDEDGHRRKTVTISPKIMGNPVGVACSSSECYMSSVNGIVYAVPRWQELDAGGRVTKLIRSSHTPFLMDANEKYVVVSYRDCHQVDMYDRNREDLFRYGTGKAGSGNGELNTPWGIAVDRRGCVFISDSQNKRVVALSPRGKLLGYIGYCDGLFDTTHPIALVADDQLVVGWGNLKGDGPWKISTFSYTIAGSLL
jgi:hypothetical protein